ncbi:MAG: hypothetical protein AAGA81_20720 [Acidobacteriota bacterium]
MQDKLKPALIGGVALGVASGVPLINLGNCICCAWVIGGGVLGTFLYLRDAAPSTQPPYGDAALVGVIAGLVGAFISTVLSTLFNMMISSADPFGRLASMMEAQGDVPPELQEMLANMGSGGGGCIGFVFSLVFLCVVYPIFAVVGSLIGVAAFHKSAPQAPSYPPPGSAPPPPPPTT